MTINSNIDFVDDGSDDDDDDDHISLAIDNKMIDDNHSLS